MTPMAKPCCLASTASRTSTGLRSRQHSPLMIASEIDDAVMTLTENRSAGCGCPGATSGATCRTFHLRWLTLRMSVPYCVPPRPSCCCFGYCCPARQSTAALITRLADQVLHRGMLTRRSNRRAASEPKAAGVIGDSSRTPHEEIANEAP